MFKMRRGSISAGVLLSCLLLSEFAMAALDDHQDKVAAAVKDLTSPSADRRFAAVQVLNELGPMASAAVSALIDALNDNELSVREQASWTLGKIGKAAVPALIQALRDKHPHVRGYAARALGVMRSEANEAIPTLIESLKEEEDGKAVADLHLTLTWLGKSVLQPSMALLSDPNARTRCRGASVLGSLANNIGADASAAVPLLIARLKDRDQRVQAVAASALGHFGDLAKGAVPHLLVLWKDNDEKMLATLQGAFGGIGPASKPAVPLILERAKNRGKKPRFRVMYDLEGIGPGASEAVPWLIMIIDNLEQDYPGKDRSEQASIAQQAARTLGAIGPEAKPAIPALNKLLTHSWDTVRVAAALALIKIEPKNCDHLVPILVEILPIQPAGLEGWPERRDAARALGELGPRAKSALPALRKMLREEKAASKQLSGLNFEAIEAAEKAIKEIEAK